MSPLELRQIIESGFLPLRCICTIDNNQKMTVSVYQSGKGHPSFIAHEIDASSLTTSRAIVDLVFQLKQELTQQHHGTLESWRKES
ncbi:DUF1652 domain-containing protein [Pseudomonas sp. LJDD11]|uniref:DUF1652 domain-containing protein n=1 Tax=unclassified Pseudomonas TaxID=196821 RepID=UPI0004F6AFBE|nr:MULTISPECIES: DUF1652 domain-containing protein [unclassified Pseudomonas]MCQ9427333.1 DUF1652 domain-containing protein [Pseudomonas sp. LJDD11]BAP45372.1 putative uncharacterized protein [Pseudomonas sp. StFLB209]